MSVGLATAAKSDISPWEEEIAALEEVFGTSFEVWACAKRDDWAIESFCEGPSLLGDISALLLGSLLEQSAASRKPQTVEVALGRYLLAIPLGAHSNVPSHFLITEIDSNSPRHLEQLAITKIRELQYAADLVELREENKFFLKQVSEDFEELAFLRLMAERLALGDCTHDESELISFMLPVLGASVSLEELYYLEGNASPAMRIVQQWLPDSSKASKWSHAQLEALVERFSDEARKAPVVKNNLRGTGLCPELPEVNEFVLVAVSTAMGPIGWLLGVNKLQPDELIEHEHLWSLSYNEFGTSEASLISTAGAMLASYAHNLAFVEERESLLVSVVRTLVSAIESKDTYTCGHSERVARYGRCLAKEVGYDQEACERLYLTGLLHDVGKIGVSDAILKKTGALTAEEFEEIQRHPDLGWAILRELDQLKYVLPGVLHHHERVDGKGYPDQLEGDDIPRDGQLLAVVDAFDAMTSDRPYRNGMPVEKALEIFREGAGTQWDAALVESFLGILPKILAIKDDYRLPPVPIRGKGKPVGGEVIADSRTANCQPVWQSL